MSKDKTKDTTTAENAAVDAAILAGITEGQTMDPTPDPMLTNPWFLMFDAPHFEPVESAKIYKNRDGSKVVAIANVILPYKVTNAITPGRIYLNRFPNRKLAPVAEFKLKGIKPLDEAANAALGAFRKWVVEQFVSKQNGPLTVGINAAAVKMAGDTGIDWDSADEDDE